MKAGRAVEGEPEMQGDGDLFERMRGLVAKQRRAHEAEKAVMSQRFRRRLAAAVEEARHEAQTGDWRNWRGS